jgi:hypothetical protein
MQLVLSELREKPFEIVASIKNIKKMHQYQLEIAKADQKAEQAQNESVSDLSTAITENELSFLEQSEAFMKDILKLNKYELDKIEELDRIGFNKVLTKITLSLQGYESDYIDQLFEEDQDSKKENQNQPVKESSSTPTN